MDTAAESSGSLPTASEIPVCWSLRSQDSEDTRAETSKRHSLPQQLLPANIWSANITVSNLTESDDAARGEHVADASKAAHRISALRQLTGGWDAQTRHVKSTGTTLRSFNRPVIVKTYSGPVHPLRISRKQDGRFKKVRTTMDAKLPPADAFSFAGIMQEVQSGVSEELNKIAEICARSNYSLSNQYEVHMPPHGQGTQYQTSGLTPVSSVSSSQPAVQTPSSDYEYARHFTRRKSRRTGSVAYGTLETIISSSKSSEEDKSRKISAKELAAEVKGKNKDLGDIPDAAEKQSSLPVDTYHERLETKPFTTISPGSPPRREEIDRRTTKFLTPASLPNPQPLTGPVMDTSLLPHDSARSKTRSILFGHSKSPTRDLLGTPRDSCSENTPNHRHIALQPQQNRLLTSLASWLPWSQESRVEDPQARCTDGDAQSVLKGLLKSGL